MAGPCCALCVLLRFGRRLCRLELGRLRLAEAVAQENRPFEVLQEAGDLIYVPALWGHAVGS